jgi:hypothetical protein
MGRRSPQTAMKRAREQALREKREMKQAKKDARSAARLEGPETPVEAQDEEETVEATE